MGLKFPDNAMDSEGRSALIACITRGKRQESFLIIAMGADLNTKFNGYTALDYAVSHNDFLVAHCILMSQRCSLDNIHNLLDFCRNNNMHEMLDLLLSVCHLNREH